MTHGAAQQICVCQAEPGELVGNAQHLLLVQDDAVRICQQRCEGRVELSARLLAEMAADKSILQTAAERTGAIQCQGNHQVIDGMRLDLTQGGAHTGAFDLEAANGARLADGLCSCGIVNGDFIQNAERTAYSQFR